MVTYTKVVKRTKLWVTYHTGQLGGMWERDAVVEGREYYDEQIQRCGFVEIVLTPYDKAYGVSGPVDISNKKKIPRGR